MINATTLLDAGLVFGALLAALAAREFKVRVPRQKRRYVQSFAGRLADGLRRGHRHRLHDRRVLFGDPVARR